MIYPPVLVAWPNKLHQCAGRLISRWLRSAIDAEAEVESGRYISLSTAADVTRNSNLLVPRLLYFLLLFSACRLLSAFWRLLAGIRSKFDKFTMVDPLGADEEEVRALAKTQQPVLSAAVRLSLS